jgi:hypothetical protein
MDTVTLIRVAAGLLVGVLVVVLIARRKRMGAQPKR